MNSTAKARQTVRRNLAKIQRADSRLRRDGRHREAQAIKKARRDATAAALAAQKAALLPKEVVRSPARKAAPPAA